jgi:hypothetical protein
MISDSERAAHARAAEAELRVTAAAFDEIRAAVIEKWAATGLDQAATREKFYLSVQCIDAVKKALLRAVQDGEVVRHSQEMAALLAPAGRG